MISDEKMGTSTTNQTPPRRRPVASWEKPKTPLMSDTSNNHALNVLQENGPQFTPEGKGVEDDSCLTTPRRNLDGKEAILLSSNKKRKLKAARQILEDVDTPTRGAAWKTLFGVDSPPNQRKRSFLQRSYTSIKEALTLADPPTKRACSAKAYPLDKPIDLKAFSINNSGKPRNSLSATDRATRRAVNKRIEALTADNDDQNLLALWKTAQHSRVRDLFRRLRLCMNSDEAGVGARLLRGVKRISARLKDNMKTGGMTKDCRTVKEILAMALAAGKANEGEGEVSDRACERECFPSWHHRSIQKLMDKGEKRSNQFFTQPLASLNVIDEEKKRWKYSEAEVERLREWMVDNPYTRDCPFGTVRRRDMYGGYIC